MSPPWFIGRYLIANPIPAIYEVARQKGNANRATLEVARRLVRICWPWIDSTFNLLQLEGFPRELYGASFRPRERQL